jgi:valyl-tRNA synthetase
VDRWILSRLSRLISDVNRLMEDYQFGEAGRQIYDFLWGEYCDWYIEATKPRLYGEDESPRIASRQAALSVLVYVLERALRLLHPFMPFVTEEIWQNLPHEGEALIVAAWPEPGPRDEAAEREMGALMDAIRAIRNARAEYDVTPGKRIPALIAAGDAVSLLEGQREVLCFLARLDPDALTIAPTLPPPSQAATVVVGDVVGYLPLAGLVDLEAERERLARELAETEAGIARSEALLQGEFAHRAPAAVVQRERDKLADLQAAREQLRARLERLQ